MKSIEEKDYIEELFCLITDPGGAQERESGSDRFFSFNLAHYFMALSDNNIQQEVLSS